MTIDAKLLALFLKHPGKFISGTAIGEAVGLSRVSVHNHLEQLKKEGFRFSAIRNKGYRLESEPDRFHPSLFEALWSARSCPFFDDYLIRKDIHSTNSLAEIELAKGRPTPFFILADQQTAGRGRRGRTWHSPAGRNFYLSIALRPSMPPARMQTITLWLGLQLCLFLRDRFSLPVMIKWPNDLMLHDHKFAGMLTEARVDADQTRDLVFGLGMNVNGSKEDFPGELQSLATSLSMNTGSSISVTRLAHAVVGVLAGAIETYLADQHGEELSSKWPEVDYLRNQQVHTDAIRGRVLGITSTGSLRLQKDDGSVLLLHSGEVSIGTRAH